MRKKDAKIDNVKDRFIDKNQPVTPPYRKNESFNVEISLDSAVTKGSDVTEVEGTSQNWLTLETDNETLRQEKAHLMK